MTAEKIRELVRQMTLEEKAGMCSGENFWELKSVERLGIPSVWVSDGPSGLRKQVQEQDHLGLSDSIEAVCFPASCATASSYDRELLESTGETLGNECQAENVSVLLGPGVNIKRSPLCGRNFEYFSEDPYLAGEMATAYINGVQSQGIGTSMKHFAANDQEFYRMSSSSDLDERTFHEIYLPAFETAVKKAQPRTIMCSYNKINGTYASENHELLTEILRDRWGFEGAVVTDWGAVADRVKGIQAGLDLEMPGSGGYHDAKIVKAVQDGTLSEADLNLAVERVLNVVFAYVENKREGAIFDREADHRKARDAAEQCAVLLANNGVLPLKAGQKIAYIGGYARVPRYQGGGSSHVHAHRVSDALAVALERGRNVRYAEGFPTDGDEYDEARAAEAIDAARDADAAVIFAGLPDSFESEGYDRDHMGMPACQNRLIGEIAKVQKNVVVVLHNGSPVETPWANDVSAILEMYLAGEGVGEATDALLYGEANPSGKLAETFPIRVEDNPTYIDYATNPLHAIYSERVYVGYRYYDKKKMPVRWAFGHGLSYTTFEYSNLALSKDAFTDGETITVSVDVKNTGAIAGREVVQLYVADRAGTPDRPVKELKGFGKATLEPGETKTVTMELDARSLSYYEVRLHDFYAPTGEYEILVGAASDDIRLTAKLHFSSTRTLLDHVDGATTIGELLGDARTASAVQQMMQQMASADPRSEAVTDSSQSESDRIMMERMMFQMPLKSLGSFGGPQAAAAIEGLIVKLNGMVK